jgi:hypothetical protein
MVIDVRRINDITRKETSPYSGETRLHLGPSGGVTRSLRTSAQPQRICVWLGR